MPPTPLRSSRTPSLQSRAAYLRTNGSMLTGGYDGPGINPSNEAPVYWISTDNWTGALAGPGGGSASALPVVLRATSLITGPLTAGPHRVLDQGTVGLPLPTPRWAKDPMLLRDDNRFTEDVYPAASKMPRSAFWAAWLRSAIWWGTGAFIYQPDETGQPLAGTLRNVNPLLVSTERVNGTLRWVLGGDGTSDRAVFDREGYLDLGPITYRIVTLRNPHSPIDEEGRSQGVFEMSPSAFGLAGQIERYSSSTFRSGVPAGYLKVNQPGLQEDDAKDLRKKWLSNHGGDRRSIAVLNSVTDFVALNLSPVDAALGESKRLNIGDVAYAFGLDPEVLGVSMGNSGTYKNIAEYWSRHRDFGLSPWIAAVEDTLSALLPGTQGVKVNLDGFANPPLKERVSTGKEAVDAGLMTIDEWRALEGLPPLSASQGTPEQSRSLSAAETAQKVYLAVDAGVLSVPEARKLIADAGADIDPDAIPALPGGAA